MPITKCSSSKATPEKGIAYIMDPMKVIARGKQLLISDDPKEMAQQMMRTMALHHKGQDPDERKYYHAKVSFAPSDRPENGGTLTPEKANEYAARYSEKTWPDREVAWAVQDHGTCIHIHFIISACDLETGKKLDARNKEYREWKDYANELAKKMDLSTLDWRRATRKKRAREQLTDLPVIETFAEEGLRSRGRAVWKDELRSIIDEAAVSCSSMTEFRAALERQGVTLTRCSETTISYKMGEHRACRGDTLGDDYTALAIQDALFHNREPGLPEGKERPALEALIGNADSTKDDAGPMPLQYRQEIRKWGREACIPRMEIDEQCDESNTMTWEKKQQYWKKAQEIKSQWWEEYREKSAKIQEEEAELWRNRTEAKRYEWVLDPRNRRAALRDIIAAKIYFRNNVLSSSYDVQIAALRRQRARLREEAAAFRSQSATTTETMRKKGLAMEEYEKTISDLQRSADVQYRYYEAQRRLWSSHNDIQRLLEDGLYEKRIQELEEDLSRAEAAYREAVAENGENSIDAQAEMKMVIKANERLDACKEAFAEDVSYLSYQSRSKEMGLW